MADLCSYRRYCFLKQKEAAELCNDMDGIWRAKRLAEPGTSIPNNLPARSLLIAAGYLVIEEIQGADETELTEAGLNSAQAAAVIAALE